MARVITIIEHDEGEHIVNGLWHAVVSYPYPCTVCGQQLEGEDGCVTSEEVDGIVTCPVCARVIEEVQAIRNWRPRRTKRAVDVGGRRSKLDKPSRPRN